MTLAQRLIERAPPQSAQELDLQVALLEATGLTRLLWRCSSRPRWSPSTT